MNKFEDIVEKLSKFDDDYLWDGSYEDIIEATGCEIIDSLKMGGYQGDMIMIVSKDYKFGVLSTGYGSCSGCDKLKGCLDNNSRANLAKDLYGKIMWKESGEIVDYLRNKDWETEYYGGEEDLPEFIEKVVEQIIIRYLAGI